MTKLAPIAPLAGATFAALAFGGTEPISFSLVELVLFTASAALLLSPKAVLTRAATRIWIIPGILLSIALLQLLPLGLSHEGTRALSASPSATLQSLLLMTAAACALFLTIAGAHDLGGRERIMKALVALGLFEAFYGLVQYLTGWQQIFTYVKKYNLEEATGTYINRNHYAGLLEMLIPLALALALHYTRRPDEQDSEGEGGVRRWLRDPNSLRAPFWLFAAMILFLAIVFSRSRMGIFSAILSTLVMTALVRLRGKRSRMGYVVPVALIGAGIAMSVWIGPEPVLQRFTQMEEEYTAGPASRIAIWSDALRLIRQHPLLGTGLGTFPIVYTQVQTTFLTQLVNSAHNDYLEYASNLGVPAAALLFGGILWLLARLARYVVRDKHAGFESTLAIGCAGSIAALLMHSLTDFNLHVPANVLVFSIVLGLACSVVYQNQQGRTRSHDAGDPARSKARV